MPSEYVAKIIGTFRIYIASQHIWKIKLQKSVFRELLSKFPFSNYVFPLASFHHSAVFCLFNQKVAV